MASVVARLEGPKIQPLVAAILAACEMDVGLKEPLRQRFKSWQKAVLSRMQSEAPDDPETGQSRLERALRAKAPVISRGRKRMTMGFVLDAAKLGASADGKNKSESRGLAWSLKQHEDGTLRHKRGNAKFMERPFMAHASRVPQILEEVFAEISAKLARV